MKWMIVFTLFFSSMDSYGQSIEWQDGDVTKKVYEVREKMIIFENGKKPVLVEKNSNESIPINSASKKYSECFSLSPNLDSRFRGLPGGIMIHFSLDFSEGQIKDWADSQNLIIKKKIPIMTKNIWSFNSEPGLKSLKLANEVIKDKNVLTASPNWWRPIRKR
jgi:hypothetical protein